MKALGVDIASAGPSAIALVIDGDLETVDSWVADPKASEPERLSLYWDWIRAQLFIYKPDIVAVERLRMTRNADAVAAIARREGLALTAARKYGAIVINPGVTTSRSIVFGNGKMSKDECWENRHKIWPDFDFGRKTSGGIDKLDAATHALAAPKAIERKR